MKKIRCEKCDKIFEYEIAIEDTAHAARESDFESRFKAVSCPHCHSQLRIDV
jgi:Zn finger protein HypA/HybF involved in hydrogenase expression